MQGSSNDQLQQSLGLLRTALQLLDEAEAPAQIGAHVDLAANLLADHLSESASGMQASWTNMSRGSDAKN